MSVRKEIRAAVVSKLKAASTAAGDRVQPSRVHNLYGATLPAISVYTTSQSYTRIGIQPSMYRVFVTIEVQGITGVVNQDTEDDLDDLTDEIQAALAVDDNLGVAGVSSIDLESAEVELFQTGDRDYAAVVFRIQASYDEEIEPAGEDEDGLACVEFPDFDGDTVVTKP